MIRTLVVADLDGTLLRPDGTLGARTVEAVNAFVAGGGLFSIATARSFHAARRLTAGLRLDLPVIVYDGAVVVDPVTGGWRDAVYFTEDQVRELLATFDGGPQPVLYAVQDGIDRYCWRDGNVSPALRDFVGPPPYGPRALPVRDWDEIDLAGVFYISVPGTAGELAGLRGLAHCHAHLGIDPAHPDRAGLDLTARDASKGRRVGDLRKETGADRLICLGDSHNDLSMFDAADEAYAVAGAPGEVRERATGVLDDVGDDAVAAWFEAVASMEGRG